MTMVDEKFALLRTHRNNIMRYRRLLNTKLTVAGMVIDRAGMQYRI
jgi:hypothetical protein